MTRSLSVLRFCYSTSNAVDTGELGFDVEGGGGKVEVDVKLPMFGDFIWGFYVKLHAYHARVGMFHMTHHALPPLYIKVQLSC
jgi:hypothetical protein